MAKHVLVNKTGAASSDTALIVNSAPSPASLTDGQLAIYNAETNAPITNGATPGLIPFYVAMGVPTGRNPRISPIIKAGAVKKIEYKAYTVPVQPVYTVGYTGSGSSSINFTQSSGTGTVSYGIKLENLTTLTPPFPKAYSQYTLRYSSSSDPKNNAVWVCDQLAADLNNQLSVMPTIDGGQFALVEVLCNLTPDTAAATGSVTPTFSIANNSNIITINVASGTVASTVLAPNVWLRINGTSTASYNANELAGAIYQVASVSGIGTSTATVTLTRPYVGPSIVAKSLVSTSLATATGSPSSSSLAGLRITVTGSYFTSNAYASGKLNSMINIPLMDQLAGTPISLTTPMVYGSGTVSEVLKKEMQALGEMGVENRIWMPLPNDTYAASNIGTGGNLIGNGYSVFSIYYENPVADKSAQGQGRIESGMLDICVNNFYTGTTVQTLTAFGTTLGSITGISGGTETGGGTTSNAWPNW
jgi:hypothetical protein